MNGDDFPPHLRGPWAKLKVYAARLALIVHFIRYVCKEADTQNVDGESVRRSALLISYFKSHARKVLAALSADPRVVAAKHVLAILKRNRSLDNFSRADLYQLARASFAEVDSLDAPLGILVNHRYVRTFTPVRPPGSRGANPVRYQVNPLWDHTQ